MQGKEFPLWSKADFNHTSAGDHTMKNFGSTTQDEILPMETAPDRKVVQISTMVHAEKDWAFVALCDDGSLWLYHGSWSQIENIPQTTDL
jgi:hypothetical protein